MIFWIRSVTNIQQRLAGSIFSEILDFYEEFLQNNKTRVIIVTKGNLIPLCYMIGENKLSINDSYKIMSYIFSTLKLLNNEQITFITINNIFINDLGDVNILLFTYLSNSLIQLPPELHKCPFLFVSPEYSLIYSMAFIFLCLLFDLSFMNKIVEDGFQHDTPVLYIIDRKLEYQDIWRNLEEVTKLFLLLALKKQITERPKIKDVLKNFEELLLWREQNSFQNVEITDEVSFKEELFQVFDTLIYNTLPKALEYKETDNLMNTLKRITTKRIFNEFDNEIYLPLKDDVVDYKASEISDLKTASYLSHLPPKYRGRIKIWENLRQLRKELLNDSNNTNFNQPTTIRDIIAKEQRFNPEYRKHGLDCLRLLYPNGCPLNDPNVNWVEVDLAWPPGYTREVDEYTGKVKYTRQLPPLPGWDLQHIATTSTEIKNNNPSIMNDTDLIAGYFSYFHLGGQHPEPKEKDNRERFARIQNKEIVATISQDQDNSYLSKIQFYLFNLFD